MTGHGHSINLTHLIAPNKFDLLHINIPAFYCLFLIKLPLWLDCIFIKLMTATYALMHITTVR